MTRYSRPDPGTEAGNYLAKLMQENLKRPYLPAPCVELLKTDKVDFFASYYNRVDAYWLTTKISHPRGKPYCEAIWLAVLEIEGWFLEPSHQPGVFGLPIIHPL